MRHELVDKIEQALEKQCKNRCLDDDDDFRAVVKTIELAIENWLDNRCPGCR